MRHRPGTESVNSLASRRYRADRTTILAALAACYVAAEIILHRRRGAARERLRAPYSDTEREAEEPVGEPNLFS